MNLKRFLATTLATCVSLSSMAFAADTSVTVDEATTETTVEVTEATTFTDETTEATTEDFTETTETTAEAVIGGADEATAISVTSLSPFSDVDITTDEGSAILKMYEKGYLAGYEDGTFRPEGNITRAELTRVFNQVFGYGLNSEAAANMADFTDNTNHDAWYYNDVRIAQSNGYINGFEDGSFRPQQNFTREQTCTVIYGAAKLEDKAFNGVISDPVSQWAVNYVNANLANNVFELEENNTFRAKENITRGEVCLALAKFVDNDTAVITEAATGVEGSTEATTTDGTTETTTKASTGGGGGGGGGGSSTVVEPTTETTTVDDPSDIEMSDEERAALERVIKTTRNEFIPRCYKADQKAIGNAILAALESYYNDSNYDFRDDISEAKDMYYAMSREDQEEFKGLALSTYSTSDINILMPLFEAFI